MSIDRIAALLAKAERTDNAEEADAYLMKAQSIATAASIDLAMARSRTASGITARLDFPAPREPSRYLPQPTAARSSARLRGG
jgi:hypothetical protein